MNNNNGKLVFVEKVGGKSDCSNGEYLCLRDTGNVLYCIKVGGVYKAHDTKQIPIIGTDCFKVLSSQDATEVMRDLVKNIQIEIAAANSGKKQLIESVYAGAESSIRRMKELLGQTPEPKLRAWTASEVPVGAILDTGCPGVVKYLIVAVTGSGVGVCSSSGTHNYPFQHLLGPDYKHSTDHGKTWKPCGVYE